MLNNDEGVFNVKPIICPASMASLDLGDELDHGVIINEAISFLVEALEDPLASSVWSIRLGVTQADHRATANLGQARWKTSLNFNLDAMALL
jgi:hypothetical protein